MYEIFFVNFLVIIAPRVAASCLLNPCAPVLVVLSCVAACVCVCMHCIDLFSCKAASVFQ